ncbi:thermonuclease family protein [Rubellimicrobium arenae]|uniref:thermonuclease family protein n=1 Tax=Rubellimicrobium arenae TaxID=2817372 RepID=UPI001B311666|nr:hypothetical protein [Rubellimicrobium arenae]
MTRRPRARTRTTSRGRTPSRRPNLASVLLLLCAGGLTAYNLGGGFDRLEGWWPAALSSRADRPAVADDPAPGAAARSPAAPVAPAQAPDRPTPPSGSAGFDIQGRVTDVRDGGTIEVAGVPVRLANLDCDKIGTDEGRSAALFMRDLVQGQAVTCTLDGRRGQDWELGTCSLSASGENVGEILIGEGVCGRW